MLQALDLCCVRGERRLFKGLSFSLEPRCADAGALAVARAAQAIGLGAAIRISPGKFFKNQV